VVITGAYAEDVSKVMENLMIDIEYNDQWQLGMGSGIVKGMRKISESDHDSVIISVCDQPYVSANLFIQMIKRKKEQNKGIVASAYSGIIGTPVLFGKEYFDKLLLLKGHEGAKSLLKSYIPDTTDIPFEEGKFDIDTMEDYNNLLLRNI
jgi:molybdenum cofactor cytidylyltransferase